MNVKNAAVNPRTTAHVQIWFSAVDSDSGRRARGTHERAEALTEGPEEACFGTLAAQSITLDGCRAVSQRHWEAHRASLSDSREHSMESMTYEMAEALSAAKLESAMVDAGPQKLHDGAAVGRTSTKNPEEPTNETPMCSVFGVDDITANAVGPAGGNLAVDLLVRRYDAGQ